MKERGALIYIGTSIGKRREEGRSDRGDSVWCFFSPSFTQSCPFFPPFHLLLSAITTRQGREGGRKGERLFLDPLLPPPLLALRG